jgi:hypothetical protein
MLNARDELIESSDRYDRILVLYEEALSGNTATPDEIAKLEADLAEANHDCEYWDGQV